MKAEGSYHDNHNTNGNSYDNILMFFYLILDHGVAASEVVLIITRVSRQSSACLKTDLM